MSNDNSGSAFPVSWPDASPDLGMSLRDYFAGKALEGYWAYAGPDRLLQGFEVTAGQCYTMADAMLAERNK